MINNNSDFGTTEIFCDGERCNYKEKRKLFFELFEGDYNII